MGKEHFPQQNPTRFLWVLQCRKSHRPETEFHQRKDLPIQGNCCKSGFSYGNEGSCNQEVPVAGHEAGREGEGGPNDDTNGHQILSRVAISKVSEYWSCRHVDHNECCLNKAFFRSGATIRITRTHLLGKLYQNCGDRVS